MATQIAILLEGVQIFMQFESGRRCAGIHLAGLSMHLEGCAPPRHGDVDTEAPFENAPVADAPIRRLRRGSSRPRRAMFTDRPSRVVLRQSVKVSDGLQRRGE